MVLAVAGLLAVVALPLARDLSSGLRLRVAAGQHTTRLAATRQTAVRYAANVGLRIEIDPVNGRDLRFGLYRDGDGDGVRSDDIEAGVDPPLPMAPHPTHFGAAVRPGFPPGLTPSDPGDPRRRLDRLDEPVRFGRSRLAVFTGIGTATPGSVYLTDGRELLVVRVFGATGRVHILRYDRESDRWLP